MVSVLGGVAAAWCKAGRQAVPMTQRRPRRSRQSGRRQEYVKEDQFYTVATSNSREIDKGGSTACDGKRGAGDVKLIVIDAKDEEEDR